MAGIVVEVDDNLAAVIQDEGLTPGHLDRNADALYRAVGSIDAEAVCEVVVKALDDLPDDKYSRALRNAFGVGRQDKTNLSERRAELLADNSFPDISEATLRRWEREAIRTLARNLVLNKNYHLGETYTYVPPTSKEVEDPLQVLAREAVVQSDLLREIRDLLRDR